MNTAIISGLFSLLGGSLGAYLTVRFALKRFRTERWWERKADAYSRIIESLHHMTVYCEMELRAQATGVPPSEEYQKERSEAYRKAARELELATAVGAYIISKQAANLLATLASRQQFQEYFSQLQEDASEYRRVLREMRELAKEDLKVR